MSNNESTPSARKKVIAFESEGVRKAKAGRVVVESCQRAVTSIVGGEPGAWSIVLSRSDALADVAGRIASRAGIEVGSLTDEQAGEWRAAADARLIVFDAARQRPPSPVASGAGAWIAVRAPDGQRWQADLKGRWQAPSWLPDVLHIAGSSIEAPIEEILAKTDSLATAAAPDARRWGAGLVLIEGLCVLLPVVWLLRGPLDLPPWFAALSGLISPLLVVTFCWWLRWRGMGRLWARSRLVAEACRSLLATRPAPVQPVIGLLSVVPSLKPLLQKFAADPPSPPGDWRADYIPKRLEDQRRYYSDKRQEAMRERRSLTRWSTVLMDVALAVGCAGVIVTLHPRSAGWLDLFGGSWLDLALGLAGMGLPLGLLMVQSLRQMGESTRRTARYTQQMVLIGDLRERIEPASADEVADLLRESENVLLSEVLDWYFQAETTEDFYAIREQRAVMIDEASGRKPRGESGLLWRFLGGVGTASGFVARVVLGRLIWVAITAAFVLLWLSFSQTKTPEHYSRLRELGRLLDPQSGALFKHQERAADYGTLIVAHGMRDGWAPPTLGGEEHWTSAICTQVRRRLGPVAPQMFILDWHEGARPSRQHELIAEDDTTAFLSDIAGVLPEGYATGDFFGARLFRLVADGKIRSDRPLQLIGHSAGGFVVARAAHILSRMGFPKDMLHVTILDTPEPDAEITASLPEICAAEFYRTSGLVKLDANVLPTRLHFRDVPPPAAKASFLAAHSYAWEWYRDTIEAARPGEDGFGRSPFCSPSR